jgi:DNA invertase Pin-like site-specific DNA recombinase
MNSRRYVAYYRVSTRAQERSGLGLEAQRTSVQNFLVDNPGEVLAEITEVESGCRNDRPKLAEALRLCRLYRATLVIARLDRLSRNVALISKLMATRAGFVAVDMPEANRFTLHIYAAVAEYEAKLISERLKGAFAAMKARGVIFRRHGTRVSQPDDLKAAWAAQKARRKQRAIAMAPLLTKLRDSGKSLYGIAAELNRLEIETSSGGSAWRVPTVRNLFLRAGEPLPLKSRPARLASGVPARQSGASLSG